MDIEVLYSLYKRNLSVQTDTRKLKPGDIYFALKGPNFNGNEFAAHALEAGAIGAVVDEEKFANDPRILVVPDGLKALQALALRHRERLNMPLLAITGSNGKTTTKELIHAVLSSHLKTYTTEGNLNNHIGVPLTLLKIKSDAQIAIIEMGANHIGEIASYCAIAKPTHGIITNCGKAHLEGFGSEEGVRKGKGELFDHLRTITHGYAFVMWDYPYLREMSKGISGIIKYGTSDAHVMGSIVSADPLLVVEMNQGTDIREIKTQLVGEYNFPNVLAAVTVGKFFNVPEEKILNAIQDYAPSNSRSQLVNYGTNKIILDAYNANPSSMKTAIENFSKMPGEKILVLGSMAELGEQSNTEHSTLLKQIQENEWKHVILVGKEFEKCNHRFLQFDRAEEAGRWLKKNNIENSTWLVKGSRSMQMEKVLG